MLLQLLIQLGLYAFKEYAKNSDSKQDDKILEAVQIGAKYLAPKSNNNLTVYTFNDLQKVEMRQTQRAK
jgi:hypothetical protein